MNLEELEAKVKYIAAALDGNVNDNISVLIHAFHFYGQIIIDGSTFHMVKHNVDEIERGVEELMRNLREYMDKRFGLSEDTVH